MRRGRKRTASDELRENGYRDGDGRYQLSDGLQPWHMRIVDYMLLNPNSKIKDVANAFDVTPQWIGQLLKTDAFREYYQMRMEEHHGFVQTQVIAKMQGVAVKSLDVMAEKLEAPQDLTIGQVQETASLVLKSLGFGTQVGGVSVRLPGGENQETLIAVRSTTIQRARQAWQERNQQKDQPETDEQDYQHITASLEKTSGEVEDAILLDAYDEEGEAP